MRQFAVPVFLVIAHYQLCSAQVIGEAAPDILFSKVLNKTGITPASLDNKYVVLDFWATWCGPCVASFPHFSELSDEFSSDSVVFAIISSEEENKVRNFLSNRPVHALYLLDSINETSKKNARINDLYGLTAQRFGVEGIPHTVVVDKHGILQWVGAAHQLKASIVKNILNGRTRQVQEEQARQKAEDENNAALRKQQFEQLKKDSINGTNYKLVIAKTPNRSSGMQAGLIKQTGKRYVQFSGHTMDFLCFYFTRTSFLRIKNFLPDKESGYFLRFEMDTAVSIQEFRNTALTALANATHVSIEKKEMSDEVWILQIADQKKFVENSKPLDATSDDRSSDESDKEIIYLNFTLATIIPSLEDKLKIFMEVEKNDLNNKVADFSIPKGDIAFINQKLFERYGIKMVKTIKKTAIIEIR